MHDLNYCFQFLICLSLQNSGRVPGVGLVHAPISLLPTLFPESCWKQACEVAPIFNELIDRVSLDAEFIQESLSRLTGSKISNCANISRLCIQPSDLATNIKIVPCVARSKKKKKSVPCVELQGETVHS